MVDTVGGGKGHMGKVIVTEFDGIREQQGLGGSDHNVKAVVVV